MLTACGASAPGLVIRNVTVVELPGGQLIEGQTVVIDQGQIVELRSGGSGPAGRIEINGSGKFLIPGLIDAHVHVDHPDELNIYPAFGVTGIFVIRGLPQHLTWRSEIGAGRRFGPRFFTTGDYMDGYPPIMQPMMSFDDVESTRESVRRQQAAGYPDAQRRLVELEN